MSTSEATLDRPAENALAAPENLLQRLLDFESVGQPFISIYLDARVDQNGRRNFLPFVRKRMTERGRTYQTHTPARGSFEEDFVRIVRYLEDGVRKDAQGIAIFSCSGARDYFEVGQFAVPFERNRVFVYDRPHVYPLARLSDAYRRYAVVLADTNRAQIFVFASGRAVEQQGIENVKTKHTRVGGWSQSRYQRHEENYHLHHAKEVVDVLARTVREEGIENIILAGDEQGVIPLLRDQMPKELAEKVVDVLSLGVDAPEHEVLKESLNAFQRYDTLSDMQKVERLLNEYRADDLGVAGVVETLAALSNGQVEEMLITASAADLEYDEAEVKNVLAAYIVEGAAPAVIDSRIVADELIRRAKELSSARVTFIEDAGLLEPVGGVGAFLRYRISEESAVTYEQAGVTPKSEALTKSQASKE
jgi:peptide chain release factor subunit 1